MPSVLIVNRTRLNAEALACAVRLETQTLEPIAADASEAKRRLREHSPELALIELNVSTGLRLVRELLMTQPALKIFVYGRDEDERELTAWTEAGVYCVVVRGVPLAELIRLLSAALTNGASSPTRTVLQGTLGATNLHHDSPADASRLTQRELDVLRLISLGLSNREVADALCLEVQTVKNHVQHVMRKLGVHRRSQAAHHLSASALTQNGSDVAEIAPSRQSDHVDKRRS